MNREAIQAALFEHLTGNATGLTELRTASRRLKSPQDVGRGLRASRDRSPHEHDLKILRREFQIRFCQLECINGKLFLSRCVFKRNLSLSMFCIISAIIR